MKKGPKTRVQVVANIQKFALCAHYVHGIPVSAFDEAAVPPHPVCQLHSVGTRLSAPPIPIQTQVYFIDFRQGTMGLDAVVS